MKRFAATGLTRDKEYLLHNKLPEGSRIVWLTENPNGEAEIVKVTLKPKLRLKNLSFDVDFAKMGIKGRSAQGNLVTKNDVSRFSLKERGASTLGGRKVWFDHDVMRLNYEGRGEYLGEFHGSDRILVVTHEGEFYTTGFELTNHYEDKVLLLEKFDDKKVWTAILNDAEQGYPYIKRFTFEDSARRQRYVGEDKRSTLIAISDHPAPTFEVAFTDGRVPMAVDATEFIGVKSFKARGKRLTTYPVAEVTETSQPVASAAEADAEAVDTPDTEEVAEDIIVSDTAETDDHTLFDDAE